MKFAQDVRSGNIIKIGRDLFKIIKAEYFRAARSGAIIKMKLRNMSTGSVQEASYDLTEKLEDIRLDKRPMQYLYESNGSYAFMDQETFDQIELSKEDLGDCVYFIKEEQAVDMMFYEGKAISIDLPKSMDLKITYTENGVRGDTSGKVMKSATLETGLEVSVPLFCNIDDNIRVDTATFEYLERVK